MLNSPDTPVSVTPDAVDVRYVLVAKMLLASVVNVLAREVALAELDAVKYATVATLTLPGVILVMLTVVALEAWIIVFS